jgi:thiamine-phosphate pyrophosphorylase
MTRTSSAQPLAFHRRNDTTPLIKPLGIPALHAFVDTAYLRGRSPADLARQLSDGGADLIQLRAKSSSPEEIRRLAVDLLPITRRANVGLVINDHLSIAEAVGAELCHLGQEDFFDAGRRHVSQLSTPNSQLKIGLSTHAASQAERALAAGPTTLPSDRWRHRHQTHRQTGDARLRPLGCGA